MSDVREDDPKIIQLCLLQQYKDEHGRIWWLMEWLHIPPSDRARQYFNNQHEIARYFRRCARDEDALNAEEEEENG